MPKKTGKPIGDPNIRILVAEFRRTLAILQEGQEASQLSIERKFDDRFERVEARLEKLEIFNQAAKAEFAALRSGQAGLKTGMAELKTDVAELMADVAELKADVAELKADVDELKAGQVRIEARLDDVVETVRRHDAALARLS